MGRICFRAPGCHSRGDGRWYRWAEDCIDPCSINCDTMDVDNITEILEQLRANPEGIRFGELSKICDRFFGQPRKRGTSHRVYRMPWVGDPRVNIQSERGMAKPYQVRQVIKALERLESMGC